MNDSTASITVRPLTERDYDATCAIWKAAGLEAKLTGRESRDAFAAQLALYPTAYLGAESGGQLIGVVMGTHDHRKGWINRLAVSPAWQRRGVGRLLLEACERALRDCGIEIIAALIEHGNDRSCRLFERSGYAADVPVHYYRKRQRPDI